MLAINNMQTSQQLEQNLLPTKMAEDDTIVTPVVNEYSPDATGRYGLFTW